MRDFLEYCLAGFLAGIIYQLLSGGFKQGGDAMQLYRHQEQILKQVEGNNKTAFYLDMGL